MSKKDAEMAADVAGRALSSSVRSIIGGLGLNEKKMDNNLDDDDLPSELAGPAINPQTANALQKIFEKMPANERSSLYYSIKRRAPGGPGRCKNGEQKGVITSPVGHYPFIEDDEHWFENTRVKIVSKYGPGDYEGTLHSNVDNKPIAQAPKWVWETVTKEEAVSYGWGTDDDDEDEDDMDEDDDDDNDSVSEDVIAKTEMETKHYEAKIRKEEKKKEYDRVLGVNEKPVGPDPVVTELRAKTESLERNLAEQKAANDRAAEKAEINDLKRMMLDLTQKIANPPVTTSPWSGMLENPIFQGVIAASLKRLVEGPPPPPAPPPPPDYLAMIAKIKDMAPPPPPPAPPLDIVALARTIKELMPAPPPPVDMLGIAKTLKDLMPQPQQSMDLPQMMTFIKDFNGKSKEMSPFEMMKQMKELAPAQQPLNDVLNQMQTMAGIMKSMGPERSDGEGELEKFARTLEAIRTIAPDIGGREEPQRSWIVDAVKALEGPVKAAGEVLARTVAPPQQQPQQQQQQFQQQVDPRIIAAQRQQIAMMQQQQRALAAGGLPQQNVPQPAQPAQPQAASQFQGQVAVNAGNTATQTSELRFGDIPVQNAGFAPPQPVAPPASAPIITPPPVMNVAPIPEVTVAPVLEQVQEAVEVPAAPTSEAEESGVDPKELAQFSTIMAVAIDKKAPVDEVLEFAQEKFPNIIELIDSYDSADQFEKDLLDTVEKLGDHKEPVVKLIEKLKSEGGKDYATEFVLHLKGF